MCGSSGIWQGFPGCPVCWTGSLPCRGSPENQELDVGLQSWKTNWWPTQKRHVFTDWCSELTWLGNQGQILLPRSLFTPSNKIAWLKLLLGSLKLHGWWMALYTPRFDGSLTIKHDLPKWWWNSDNLFLSSPCHLLPEELFTLCQLPGSTSLLSSWEYTPASGLASHTSWGSPEGGITWPMNNHSLDICTEVILS